MDKILELENAVAAIRADKHARHESLTTKEESEITEKIKSMQAEKVKLITEGAKLCSCETSPHGMIQYTALKGKPKAYFEIGCLACNGKRAQGFSREEAVSNWNSETYI